MSYDPRDDEYDATTPIERTSCEHEDVNCMTSICQNCWDVIEDEEPSDAQIFAQYGQTKIPGYLAA